MVGAALAGNAALQLGGNLIGGYFSNQAADKQARAAENALNFKKMVYNKATQQYEPYIESGERGLAGYEDRITNLTAPDYEYKQKAFDLTNWQDPGYKFRIDQANQAINAAAAKAGYNLSPGVSKALQTRGQDLASQEYQNSFNRYQTQEQMNKKIADDNYARQMGFKTQDIQNFKDLTGFGQNAIAGTAQAATGIGDSMLQVGQANAMGDTSKAGMWTNSAQMLGKGFSDYLLEMEKQNKAKS